MRLQLTFLNEALLASSWDRFHLELRPVGGKNTARAEAPPSPGDRSIDCQWTSWARRAAEESRDLAPEPV